jgi:type I restriction enzyme M protein
VLKEYGKLTEDDMKSLVLDEKWHAIVKRRIVSEVTSLTHDLVARIQQLGKRYAETVSELEKELDDLDSKVAEHLAAMGIR